MNDVQDVEDCACPICEADLPVGTPYRSGVFRVVRCGSCRVWYLSPRLSEEKMAEYYRSGDYYEGGSTGYESYALQEQSLRATFRCALAQMARRGMTGGSVLDIGCGFGYFLQEAAPHFQFRAGTEFSPTAAAQARTRADEIYVGGIDSVPSERAFDCITAFQVIEHIYHPHDFLRRLREQLSDGGSIVLAAPDMGSFWRKAMGRRWPSFKYPEHVVFYDARTLEALMRRAGLADIQRVPFPHAFPLPAICEKLGLPQSMRFNSWNVWLPATTIALVGRTSRRKPG